MTTLLLHALAGPVLLGVVSAVLPGARSRYAPPASAAFVLVTGLTLLAGPEVVTLGWLRADRLSAVMLCVVGAVGLSALGPRYPHATRWYPALLCLFLAAMSTAVLADNLGMAWVAIEATTITTAFLVGHNPGARPLEAAWKYVVLGSVGIAVALLGIVILYAATRATGTPTLSWVEVTTLAGSMDPQVTRLGICLATLGFATKAGLAPMHAWLPDAHGQAPAAVSGLMSGVLLAVALYLVLRLRTIGDLVFGDTTMRVMLLTLGLLSLTVGAVLTLTQRDLKRLLAYSSIEHMGIMAVAASIGGRLATAALLVHLLGHGLVKSALFVQAGRMLTAHGTSAMAAMRGLLVRAPALAGPWVVGMAALVGFPPFPLFFTEVAIVVAGIQAGLAIPMIAVVGLLLVAFTGLTRATIGMTLGRPDADGRSDQVDPDVEALAVPLHGQFAVPVTLAAAACLTVAAVLGWPVVAEAVTALADGRLDGVLVR